MDLYCVLNSKDLARIIFGRRWCCDRLGIESEYSLNVCSPNVTNAAVLDQIGDRSDDEARSKSFS